MVEEPELLMPADTPAHFQEELPDDFVPDAGEMESEAKALLEVAFSGNVS